MKKILKGIMIGIIVLLFVPFFIAGGLACLLYYPIDRIRYIHSGLFGMGVKYRFGISLSSTFQVVKILRNRSFTLVPSVIVGQNIVSFLINETRYFLLCFDLSEREGQLLFSPEMQEWVFEYYEYETKKRVSTALLQEMKQYVEEHMLVSESDIQYLVFLTKGSRSEWSEQSDWLKDPRVIGSEDLLQRLTQNPS